MDKANNFQEKKRAKRNATCTGNKESKEGEKNRGKRERERESQRQERGERQERERREHLAARHHSLLLFVFSPCEKLAKSAVDFTSIIRFNLFS